MTVRKLKTSAWRIEALVAEDRDLPTAPVKEVLEEVRQATMTDCLVAGSRGRTAGRLDMGRTATTGG